MARTFVYLDGVNLYFHALKGTPHKRLDIEAMSRAVLAATCAIERINYYTAHISGRLDPRLRWLMRFQPVAKQPRHWAVILPEKAYPGRLVPPL